MHPQRSSQPPPSISTASAPRQASLRASEDLGLEACPVALSPSFWKGVGLLCSKEPAAMNCRKEFQ